jgi:hypothetical protein
MPLGTMLNIMADKIGAVHPTSIPAWLASFKVRFAVALYLN